MLIPESNKLFFCGSISQETGLKKEKQENIDSTRERKRTRATHSIYSLFPTPELKKKAVKANRNCDENTKRFRLTMLICGVIFHSPLHCKLQFLLIEKKSFLKIEEKVRFQPLVLRLQPSNTGIRANLK